MVFLSFQNFQEAPEGESFFPAGSTCTTHQYLSVSCSINSWMCLPEDTASSLRGRLAVIDQNSQQIKNISSWFMQDPRGLQPTLWSYICSGLKAELSYLGLIKSLFKCTITQSLISLQELSKCALQPDSLRLDLPLHTRVHKCSSALLRVFHMSPAQSSYLHH